MKEAIAALTKLEKKIKIEICKKFDIKKLNLEQNSLVSELALVIAQNEEIADWENNIEKYLNNPAAYNQEILHHIDELAAIHSIDNRSAAILYHSKK